MVISLYLRNCIDTEHIDVLNQRIQSFSRENTYTSKWEQQLTDIHSRVNISASQISEIK